MIHHIQGNPQSMQKRPKYKNALLEIYDFFEKKIKEVRSHGIKHNNILLDPGIGFGKNLKHNLSLLKNISIFHSLGLPLLYLCFWVPQKKNLLDKFQTRMIVKIGMVAQLPLVYI